MPKQVRLPPAIRDGTDSAWFKPFEYTSYYWSSYLGNFPKVFRINVQSGVEPFYIKVGESPGAPDCDIYLDGTIENITNVFCWYSSGGNQECIPVSVTHVEGESPNRVAYVWLPRSGEYSLHIGSKDPVFTPSVFTKYDGRVLLLYDFSEAGSNMLYDKSGNENHGVIVGGRWVDAEDGPALYFDGNTFIWIKPNESLQQAMYDPDTNAYAYCIMAVLKPDNMGSGYQGAIIEQGYGSGVGGYKCYIFYTDVCFITYREALIGCRTQQIPDEPGVKYRLYSEFIAPPRFLSLPDYSGSRSYSMMGVGKLGPWAPCWLNKLTFVEYYLRPMGFRIVEPIYFHTVTYCDYTYRKYSECYRVIVPQAILGGVPVTRMNDGHLMGFISYDRDLTKEWTPFVWHFFMRDVNTDRPFTDVYVSGWGSFIDSVDGCYLNLKNDAPIKVGFGFRGQMKTLAIYTRLYRWDRDSGLPSTYFINIPEAKSKNPFAVDQRHSTKIKRLKSWKDYRPNSISCKEIIQKGPHTFFICRDFIDSVKIRRA